MTREQFWAIVSTRGFPHPNANRLFSSFDLDHSGSMDYRMDFRYLLASLRALRRPSEDTITKMTAMFKYFLPDDGSCVARSDVVACLLVSVL